jgi:hypothetical protein
MEKINQLLEKLNYKLPISLSKRYDKLKNLLIEVKKQEKEYSENEDDDSKNALDEIIEFYEQECEELQYDLIQLVNKKQQAENKAKAEAENKAKVEAENRAKAEAENRAKRQAEIRAKREAEYKAKIEAENKNKEEETKQPNEEKIEEDKNLKTEKEKKSGIGWGSLVLGGALLILSAGAINYFGKRN